MIKIPKIRINVPNHQPDTLFNQIWPQKSLHHISSSLFERVMCHLNKGPFCCHGWVDQSVSQTIPTPGTFKNDCAGAEAKPSTGIWCLSLRAIWVWVETQANISSRFPPVSNNPAETTMDDAYHWSASTYVVFNRGNGIHRQSIIN